MGNPIVTSFASLRRPVDADLIELVHLLDAWTEGDTARNLGFPATRNPYPVGGEMAAAWDAGWHQRPLPGFDPDPDPDTVVFHPIVVGGRHRLRTDTDHTEQVA